MQLLITASSDSYITDKIIDNTYRSKNSNVGHASSLDLFKLFEESGIVQGGNFVTENISEISAILIKFDYEKIHALTSSILDIRNFKASLELTDISSGLQKPFNFSALCSPLKTGFEEGFGIDVNRFDDLGSVNFITASYFGNSPVLWQSEGASSGGGTGNVKAIGRITVVGEAGWGGNPTFSLNDGTNTVSFSKNVASETPSRTNATNYTFGLQNVPAFPAGSSIIAKRIFDAIVLAKSNGELNITASDPLEPEVDVSFVDLTQDSFGPNGNTQIVSQNSADAFEPTNFSGGYDETHIDFYTSGSNGAQVVDYGSSFVFSNPNDNAVFDITTAVSASIKNIISNNGFRISFSGSFATDNKTRFVKRFASRHVSNKNIVPVLRIMFDSSELDSSSNFYIDRTNKVLLRNYNGVDLKNLIDQSGAEVVGSDCGRLVISSGSYSQTVNFSQSLKSSSGDRLTGVYEASFSISSNDVSVKKAILKHPESFDVKLQWKTSDLSKILLEEEIKILNHGVERLDLSTVLMKIDNLKKSYSDSENIELFISSTINGYNHKAKKVSSSPIVFPGVIHYSIRDLQTGLKVIDYDLDMNSTKLSKYKDKFSLSISPGTLKSGHVYVLNFSTLENGNVFVFDEDFILRVN